MILSGQVTTRAEQLIDVTEHVVAVLRDLDLVLEARLDGADNRPPYVQRQRNLGHPMLRPPTPRRRLASHPPLRWPTLCERNPKLQIRMLAWDFHMLFALEREWMQPVFE